MGRGDGGVAYKAPSASIKTKVPRVAVGHSRWIQETGEDSNKDDGSQRGAARKRESEAGGCHRWLCCRQPRQAAPTAQEVPVNVS